MASNWLILNKKTAYLVSLAVFLLALDRYFKQLSISGYRFELVPGWLNFSFEKNYGIAFSLPLGGLLLNCLVSFIVASLAIWGLFALKKARYGHFLAILAVFLGAASNLFDRLAYGAVIDYFSLQYFTIFNLADVLVCLGVGGLIWLNIDK